MSNRKTKAEVAWQCTSRRQWEGGSGRHRRGLLQQPKIRQSINCHIIKDRGIVLIETGSEDLDSDGTLFSSRLQGISSIYLFLSVTSLLRQTVNIQNLLTQSVVVAAKCGKSKLRKTRNPMWSIKLSECKRQSEYSSVYFLLMLNNISMNTTFYYSLQGLMFRCFRRLVSNRVKTCFESSLPSLKLKVTSWTDGTYVPEVNNKKLCRHKSCLFNTVNLTSYSCLFRLSIVGIFCSRFSSAQYYFNCTADKQFRSLLFYALISLFHVHVITKYTVIERTLFEWQDDWRKFIWCL